MHERASAGIVTKGPLAVFDRSCANCHGPNGSFYGPEFGKSLSDAALRTKVGQMITGPARLKLDERSVEAMVAFHRALIAREPFLVITRREGGEIEGEVSIGARVVVRSGGRETSVTVTGTEFRASGVGPGEIEIRATDAAGRITLLNPDRAAFSHAK